MNYESLRTPTQLYPHNSCVEERVTRCLKRFLPEFTLSPTEGVEMTTTAGQRTL
jgi:hypothetical protein